MEFKLNPCKNNALAAFEIPKSETQTLKIRRLIDRAKQDWKKRDQAVLSADGSLWKIREAELMPLESDVSNPLKRLKVEQFVHEDHPFEKDEALKDLCEELLNEAPQPGETPPQVLDSLRESILGRLGRFVPEPQIEPLADDEAWPQPPDAYSLEFEPLKKTILREK